MKTFLRYHGTHPGTREWQLINMKWYRVQQNNNKIIKLTSKNVSFFLSNAELSLKFRVLKTLISLIRLIRHNKLWLHCVLICLHH